jgi:hypothetical protein
MTSKIEAPEDSPTLKTVSSLTHHRPPKSFPPLVKVLRFVKSAYFRGQKKTLELRMPNALKSRSAVLWRKGTEDSDSPLSSEPVHLNLRFWKQGLAA